jgi:hypothetical protein
MSNILRKIRVAIFLFGFGFISISCKQDDSYNATILTDKDEIHISESRFYIKENGTVFYYINDENTRNKFLKIAILRKLNFLFWIVHV